MCGSIIITERNANLYTAQNSVVVILFYWKRNTVYYLFIKYNLKYYLVSLKQKNSNISDIFSIFFSFISGYFFSVSSI